MALLLAACTKSAPGPSSSSSSPSTTTRPEPVTVGLNQPFPLDGLTVTVTAATADVTVASQQPDPGQGYVRYGLDARNGGPRPVGFAPAAVATLVDDTNTVRRVLPGVFPEDLAGAAVPAGGEVTGTVTFVVPSDRTPDHLVFASQAGITDTVKVR